MGNGNAVAGRWVCEERGYRLTPALLAARKSGRCVVAVLALFLTAALGGAARAASAPAFTGSPAACANVEYGRANLGGGADPLTSPNPNGATLVGAGVFVTQLGSLDAVREEYSFRGHVRATWCDPRLAYDPNEVGTLERVYIGGAEERERERIWLPAGFPVNRAGPFEVTERVMRVAPDGTVHNDLNISVQVHADLDLRRFPFDHQRLELELESFRWQVDDMVFVADPTATGFAQDFTMQEWELLGVSSRVEEVASVRGARPFSHFVFEIDVERKAGFYLWKVMLPILIIVAISWSVFWMTDERLAGRSRITASGVLTVVAYQFVIADGLPRIAYLTVLDKMMLVSFALLSVTVLQSMAVAHYNKSAPETALLIDRTSRWLFPLVYALLLAAYVFSGG